MRLQAAIDLALPGEAVKRPPSWWDKVKTAFGGQMDLTTNRTRVALEATTLVDQVRLAMGRLGIANAVSLVIDDQVIFRDAEGRPDDMGDLVIALSDHAPVFGAGFSSLRLALEHEEAGLHLVLEIAGSTEHPHDEPAVAVRIGGRVHELEARSGETAESYRARVAHLVDNPGALEQHRRQFEAFVARLADALRSAFPEARVLERRPEAVVVRPQGGRAAEPRPRRPQDPQYDPYPVYYRSPFEGMLSGLLIGSFLSSAFHPGIMVVHPSGAPIASAADLSSHTGELSSDAADPGLDSGDADVASGEDVDAGGDVDSDFGGFDDFGGDFGGDF